MDIFTGKQKEHHSTGKTASGSFQQVLCMPFEPRCWCSLQQHSLHFVWVWGSHTWVLLLNGHVLWRWHEGFGHGLGRMQLVLHQLRSCPLGQTARSSKSHQVWNHMTKVFETDKFQILSAFGCFIWWLHHWFQIPTVWKNLAHENGQRLHCMKIHPKMWLPRLSSVGINILSERGGFTIRT